MKPGDIAWRCLDCEKDTTCIICKECFEKSDHTGHRIQIKKNVGGCCDCGDPEAWDEQHFCSDHIGQQAFDPQQILNNLPHEILDSATNVFNVICRQLKLIQMKLQNFEELCLSEQMSSDTYKNTQVNCIKLIYQFITDRIDECPSFIHIVDKALTQIYFDVDIFQKNQEHQSCCFIQYSDKDKTELNKLFGNLQNNEKLFTNFCSCSALDLSMQTNHFLNDESRKIIYDLFFKLFQSYLFKQRLAYSFAANYEKLMSYNSHDKDHISVIGVQILTSDELSMIIFKNKQLWENMLQCFTKKCVEFSKDFQNQNLYYKLNEIINDFKYMARPESLKYCIEKTDFIEKFLKSLKHLYFIDTMKQRDTMIEFAANINIWLLNIEIVLVKVVHLYLKEIPILDKQKNQQIILAFFQTFAEIDYDLKKFFYKDGFISLPLHRSFCYYFSRLLFFNSLQDSSIHNNLSMQQKFKLILDYNLDKNFNQISSLKSDDEDENSQHYDIIQNFKNILLTQIKSISFIHEVLSRKWVYHGYQLEHFPHVYYKLADSMSYQDLCTFQIILSFDQIKVNQCQSELFDFFIDNFGLDGQLKIFIDNIKQYKASEQQFLEKWPKFDVQKLKQQIQIFLRFLIQICTQEVSYMKQLYNKKEEILKAANHHIKNTNQAQIKKLWSHVVEKEVVHMLLLNKVNTNIVVFKESINEIFIKDQVFEEALFKVSDQARDIKNQVTFRIKDEYIPWWDPFQYFAPDQYSLAFQMYDQNGLKDKFLQEGLNDVVGDYLDKYTFATEINEQLIFNMSRSSLIKIICPLICIFLRKEENLKDDQEKKIKNVPIDLNCQKQNLNSAQIITQIAEKKAFMGKFKQYKNFEDEANMFYNSCYYDQQLYFNKADEAYLNEIVDQNIGNHCIKLFLLILKSFTSKKNQNQISENQKNNFIKEISIFDNKLAKSFIQNRNILIQKQQQEQQKIKIQKVLKIYTFILDLIYQLDPKTFLLVGQSLGYVNIESNQFIKEQQVQYTQIITLNDDQNIDNAKTKKDLLKKKQNKLISKMKLKSQKLLNKNNMNCDYSNLNDNTTLLSEDKIQEENLTCAFCQEELTKFNFHENPFGNFGYVQSNSVLYHAVKQTIQNLENAFKNADYSFQFGDHQQSSLIEPQFFEEEKKQSSLINLSSQQIDDNKRFKQQIKFLQEKPDQEMENSTLSKIDFQHICKFLNNINGSGAVITSCKHYSHLSCASKYQKEQLTTMGQFYQHRYSGFNLEEFSCPICKTLANTLLPLFSFNDIALSEVKTSDNLKSTIDFYMNLFSKIILCQQGVVSKEDAKKKSLTKSITFSNIKSDSARIINHFINFLIHNISLIDLKGLPNFETVIQKLQIFHSSFGSILKLAFQGKKFELKFFKQELSFNKTIEFIILQQIEKLKCNIFSQNISVFTIQILFLFSFLKVDEIDQQTQQSKFQKLMNIIQLFYPILRLQIAIAAYFRQQDGSIRGIVHNLQENVFNAKNLDKLKQTKDFQNISVDVELSVMRKIYATVQILKIIYFSQHQQQNKQKILHDFKQVSQKESNQEELNAIIQELNLGEQKNQSFEEIFEEKQIPIFFQQEQDENGKINQIYLQFKFISHSKFLKDSFNGYFASLAHEAHQQNNSLLEDKCKIKMPHLLMTMTPYVTFDFYDIPKNFMSLQTQYYKRNCSVCKSHSLDSATCLLCGETFCWFKNKCPNNLQQSEGLLSQHTKEKEGGQAVFLYTSSGGIILMNRGNSCIVDTPYRNKYGELISEKDKRYDQYVIDSQGGGYEAIQLIRKKFINFQQANDIIQQRTNPDVRYKVYNRNVL